MTLDLIKFACVAVFVVGLLIYRSGHRMAADLVMLAGLTAAIAVTVVAGETYWLITFAALALAIALGVIWDLCHKGGAR